MERRERRREEGGEGGREKAIIQYSFVHVKRCHSCMVFAAARQNLPWAGFEICSVYTCCSPHLLFWVWGEKGGFAGVFSLVFSCRCEYF